MGYSGPHTRKSPIRCQKHQENELHILKHDLWLPSKVELLNARTMFHSLHFEGAWQREMIWFMVFACI